MRAATIASLLALGACGPPDVGPESEERTYSRKTEEVWAAAIEATRDLDLSIDSGEHDSGGGLIEARYAEGDPVRIDVRSVTPDRTTVSIRGRSGTAELLFDRISTRLGAREPADATP